MTDPVARLAALVHNAGTFVPFYRRHWAIARQGPPRIRCREDFEALPLVTKQDLLNAAPAELIDQRYTNRPLHVERTSGSSGQVFEMHYSAAARRRRQLRFLRALVGAGYRPGRSLMIVSSQSAATIAGRRRWERWLRWSHADLDDAAAQIAATYETARPDTLYGPLSALLELGASLEARGVTHRPRRLVSTGEQVTAGHRRRLESIFGAPLADFYGMTEFGLMAWRRNDSGPYRLCSRDLHLEYLPTPYDKGLDRLVASDLRRGAQPLIRFDTGDLVRRDRALPDRPIVEFVGRDHDALVLPGQRRVAPYRITSGLESIEDIRAFRVVQQPDASVDLYLDCGTEIAAARARRLVTQALPGLSVRLHWQNGPLSRQPGKQSPVISLAGRRAS